LKLEDSEAVPMKSSIGLSSQKQKAPKPKRPWGKDARNDCGLQIAA
jgi:hypothetical protein